MSASPSSSPPPSGTTSARSSPSKQQRPQTPTAQPQQQPPQRSQELQQSLAYSRYFRRYELLIEYKNLWSPEHSPRGVYVVPAADSLYVWQGVVFVYAGCYRHGVFKFVLDIPETYPYPASGVGTGMDADTNTAANTNTPPTSTFGPPPSVSFHTEMFHPLVQTSTGKLNLAARFPHWRPHQDYLCHVLHFIKNMFTDRVLDGLQAKDCYNIEALNMYKNERDTFDTLAQQCADVSSADVILYDNSLSIATNHLGSGGQLGGGIRFTPLTEDKLDEVKRLALRWTGKEEDLLELGNHHASSQNLFHNIRAGISRSLGWFQQQQQVQENPRP